MAVHGEDSKLHGVGSCWQRWDAHGEFLGIIGPNLDIVAVDLLSLVIPHRELGELRLEPFVKP
jgi:hypothetical protein